jgi:hypothetical protein
MYKQRNYFNEIFATRVTAALSVDAMVETLAVATGVRIGEMDTKTSPGASVGGGIIAAQHSGSGAGSQHGSGSGAGSQQTGSGSGSQQTGSGAGSQQTGSSTTQHGSGSGSQQTGSRQHSGSGAQHFLPNSLANRPASACCVSRLKPEIATIKASIKFHDNLIEGTPVPIGTSLGCGSNPYRLQILIPESE